MLRQNIELSWKLIFDAYSTSSFKIRNDFTDGLRTENYLGQLLEFTFDVLGHSAAQAIKLDKVNITHEQIKDYNIKLADAETEEQSMHWLLVHLFYLTLKYIPGLFRTWYLDCRSKQTKIAVEAWTEAYFSPLIIDDALGSTDPSRLQLMATLFSRLGDTGQVIVLTCVPQRYERVGGRTEYAIEELKSGPVG